MSGVSVKKYINKSCWIFNRQIIKKRRMMYRFKSKGFVIDMSQWEVILANRQECLLRFESDVTLQRKGLSVSVSLLQNKVGSLGKNLTHHLCPWGEDVSSLCSLFLCVTCLYLKT